MIDYLVTIILMAGIYAIFSLGLNLEWGFTGLLNFGHVGFMAIGAYTTVLLSTNGVPLWLSVLAAIVVAGLMGALLGVPTLKLREDYLAITTIGFSEIVRFILHNESWLTNGSIGIGGFPRPFRDMVLAREYDIFLMVLILLTLLVVYLTLEILIRSPWGRILKSIRDDEEVSASLGKNVFSYKVQSLVIGSMAAAVAGSMLAFYMQFINPTTFMPLETFYAWIIIMVGGSGNNRGVLLGAILFQCFFSGSRFVQGYLPLEPTQVGALRIVIIGLALVLLMIYRPEGILGKKEELSLES
jgi:neutral amino acid transport system permease protein